MRLPKTARPVGAELPEVYIGKGDYAAGGARSLPFLDLDCARRRRPLVLGEVTDDLSSYPKLAADMFSGRQTDPAEWAVMWKELGADGVCIRIHGEDPLKAAELVETVAERTRLPVAVDAPGSMVSAIAERVGGSRLLLLSDGPVPGIHLPVLKCRDAEDAAEKSVGLDEAVVMFGSRPLGDGMEEFDSVMEEYRGRGLSGEAACRFPILADVTSAWDLDTAVHGNDARRISLWEASGALAAMLAGADILVVRGPGAADMARVYGEELADL